MRCPPWVQMRQIRIKTITYDNKLFFIYTVFTAMKTWQHRSMADEGETMSNIQDIEMF